MVLFLSYNYLLESSVFLYRPSAFPVFFMLVLNESLYYMYTDATRVEEGRKGRALLEIKKQGTYCSGEGGEEPAM